MAKVATNLVAGKREKKEKNTPPVDPHQQLVKKKAKENLGVKNQQKEKNNEII